MKLDAELVGVLSYLRDLGWTELYKVPPEGREAGADAPPRQGALDEAASSAVESAPAKSAATAQQSSPPSPVVGASGGQGKGKGGDSRAARLALLEERALGCSACKLAAGRKNVVFGSGSAEADLMFIGEGPGAHEDRQGLPFVGPAGELLTKIIGAIGLSREEVYIANMVKCRPPNNRDPEPDELTACRSFLEEQIALVEPKIIVALGRVAAQALLETDRALGKMRGEWFMVQGVETRVTYHPAALLRNASFKRPVWEDMQLVRDRLEELT